MRNCLIVAELIDPHPSSIRPPRFSTCRRHQNPADVGRTAGSRKPARHEDRLRVEPKGTTRVRLGPHCHIGSRCDALKIDQAFVREISAGGDDTILVGAIIAMARSLMLRVTAEGVETQAELDFLQTHQCDDGQGYYFSRPVPPEQFARLLETGIPATVFSAHETSTATSSETSALVPMAG